MKCVSDYWGQLQDVPPRDIFLTLGSSHRAWQVPGEWLRRIENVDLMTRCWDVRNDWEGRFFSENVDQGADKDVGGGEDPEVLQEVPQQVTDWMYYRQFASAQVVE